MPRITVNINQKLNNKLLKISKEQNESLSQIIKQFIEVAGWRSVVTHRKLPQIRTCVH
jgi:predicted CopG family antitoxin